MATKDISDLQVVMAYFEARAERDAENARWPEDILMERTGQCEKVCFRAMERADRRGYLDYGVSLHAGWVTEEGKQLVRDACAENGIPVPPEIDPPKPPIDERAQRVFTAAARIAIARAVS